MGGGLPAAVVVAHDDPPQVRRLLAALAPLRVFLHVDANSSDEVARAILAGQPERVVALQDSIGWAHRGILDAEIMGYRAALAETDAEHIVLCTGADYPLQSTRRIVELLDRHRGLSFGDISALPIEHWGRCVGMTGLSPSSSRGDNIGFLCQPSDGFRIRSCRQVVPRTRF